MGRGTACSRLHVSDQLLHVMHEPKDLQSIAETKARTKAE